MATAETARVISKRIDTVLRDAAYTEATLENQATATIDNDAVTAALAHYGDRVVSGEIVSLVIHSRQWLALKGDPKFERVEDNRTTGLAGVLDGIVPVYMSDLITVMEDQDAGSDETHYRALVFAGNPLAYAHKKDVETAQAEDILARTVTIVSSLYFAGGVMTPGDVVELRTQ